MFLAMQKPLVVILVCRVDFKWLICGEAQFDAEVVT
jgi:hypothetical protein